MSETPAPKHGNKKKLFRTLDEFQLSEYVRYAQDPQVLARVLPAAAKLVARLGKGHPLARRVHRALGILSSLKGDDLLSARNIVLLGGALIYAVSPVDAVPDILPVVGFMDDIAVLAAVLAGIRTSSAHPPVPENPLPPDAPSPPEKAADRRQNGHPSRKG